MAMLVQVALREQGIASSRDSSNQVQALLVKEGAVRYNLGTARLAASRFGRISRMQRIAGTGWVACSLLALVGTARGQIITAQPAPSVQSAPFASGSPAPFNPRYAGTGGYAPNSPVSIGGGGMGSGALANSPEANTIRGWYRDYLGRDVGQDLSSLASMLRGGMSPVDMQATILGSDEFYWQKGTDPQTFVRETLQAVTWTEPSYAEIQRWTTRLSQLRNDRFALAREILLEVNQTPAQSDQWRDITTRLTSAARLAVDTINFEIGGTPQGRQANLQAVALLDAMNRLTQVTTSGISQGADANYALGAAERSLLALQTTLSNPPGTAPSAAGVVRRIGTMLNEARAATLTSSSNPTRPTYPLPSTPTIPLPPPPVSGSPLPGSSLPGSSLPGSTLPGYPSQGPPGSVQGQVAEPLAAARRAAESLIQTLTNQVSQDYAFNTVLRDLDTLASRLATLESLTRTGLSQQRLSLEVQSVVDSVSRVEAGLGSTRLPYLSRMYWQSVKSSVEQLREIAGVAPPGNATTLLRPAAWHESLLPLLDQAAAQLDVFLAGTTPLVYGVLEVPSVQADARSLKNRVLLMREQAGQGQPAAVLKQTLSGMVGDYLAAFDRWNRIVATNRLTAPARLSPVGETLNRVEQIINNALATGDASPTAPTRMSQDLLQLNVEIADARRMLSVFSAYRELPSMNLYLEQLSGYVQQLTDAGQRQNSAEQRRLAVGMQSVVGNLQTDAASLARRVVGVAGLQQQASDVTLRINQIGRLVDEIEAQLY